MSKPLSRTYSLRKHIRPITDINEEDDDQRRDSYGRKRVDVVHCLLDSSSDELDELNINIEKLNNILWLAFNEICHIRYVLTQTSLSQLMYSDDKQYSKIRRGRLCFRCRKKINEFFFLPAFLRPTNHDICCICRQVTCKKCSFASFIPPSHKLSIPIRIQNLIKPSSTSSSIENEKKNTNESNTKTRAICYDCLQVFNEHITTSQPRIKPPVNTFRRTLSLPPISSKTSDETQHTRHRPLPITNGKTEKTIIITTTPLIME